MYLFLNFFKKILYKIFIPIILLSKGVQFGKRVRFYGLPLIFRNVNSRIIIGSDSTLCSVSSMTALGLNHPVVLRTISENSQIIIGNETGISGGTICASKSITIGDKCLIGANVTIVDTDFHTINSNGRHTDKYIDNVNVRPVFIADNVFIGTGAIILKGVNIGENSVIAAHSVVTKSIPANVIAGGNPAVVLKVIK